MTTPMTKIFIFVAVIALAGMIGNFGGRAVRGALDLDHVAAAVAK
jgi:hypothetical protein